MIKIIALDIETTGFSRQWDCIIELAAICYNEESGEQIDCFHEYIKPNRSIPANITALTGISNSTVVNCRSEKEVLMDFAEWFIVQNPDKVIGHNCKTFDLQFIGEKSAKYNTGWNLCEAEVIDTLALCRQLKKAGKLNVENLKQPTIAAFFGIQYDAHSAINDIEALIKIYKKIQQLNNPNYARAALGF